MKREIRFVPIPMLVNNNSLEILFQVIGELGVVEFHLSTNWYTDDVVELRLKDMKNDVQLGKEDYLLKHFWMGPQPLDVCYFSPVRKSEDDSYWENGAPYHAPHIVPCYYGYRYEDEGEGIWTTDFIYEKLLHEGNDGVWNFLEIYYREVFGELR
jgi:hypothetical protein